MLIVCKFNLTASKFTGINVIYIYNAWLLGRSEGRQHFPTREHLLLWAYNLRRILFLVTMDDDHALGHQYGQSQAFYHYLPCMPLLRAFWEIGSLKPVLEQLNKARLALSINYYFIVWHSCRGNNQPSCFNWQPCEHVLKHLISTSKNYFIISFPDIKSWKHDKSGRYMLTLENRRHKILKTTTILDISYMHNMKQH